MDPLGVEFRFRPPYERLPSNASFSRRDPSPAGEEIRLNTTESLELPKPPNNQATLRHKQQSHGLWLRFTLRWIITLIFAALIIATLKILFNLLAQISVALISLTFSVDDGKTYNDTYFTGGLVHAPNMTNYHFRKPGDSLTLEESLGIAHSFGESYQSSKNCGRYNQSAEIYDATKNPPYFCRTGQPEFAYRFKEYNQNDTERMYPSLTNRIITTSCGRCFKYEETSQTAEQELNAYGTATLYTFSNGSHTENIAIPLSHQGWAATTYVYRGQKLPQRATGQSCGDRCLWIWAVRFGVQDEPESTLFQCPITVGNVTNTALEAHKVPNGIALVTAASIALNGRWSGKIEDKHWTQYQFYPWTTAWETHGQPDTQVGANMAQFALRSIAAMADRNPRIKLPGRVPHLGSRLNVYNGWLYVAVLLACIVGAHFLLFVGTAWSARSVVVVKDSHMAIARWLEGSG
ncbi:MAG: hypothetical protein Q9193_006438 [Seirophora villosa]